MRSLAVAAFVILSASVAPGQAAPPRKQLVEDLRLDANAEDFPAIRYFSVGPKGQIVVEIDEDQQLRFYDASGKKYATFGRKGSGPGEFQRIVRLGWIADTLWVSDFDLRRITYISPAVKLLRSDVVAPKLNEGTTGRGEAVAGHLYSFAPWAVTPDGILIGPAMETVGRNATGQTETKSLVIATTHDGAGRKTIAIPPKTTRAVVNYRGPNGSGASTVVPFMFYPETQYSFDGTRLAFLTADTSRRANAYSVTALRVGVKRKDIALDVAGGRGDDVSHGDTLFTRTYATVSEPIPGSAMDSAINTIGSQKRSDGGLFFPPDVARKLQEMVRQRVPVAYAPVSGLVMGLDGTTWVLLRKLPTGTTAVALDAKGNPVASILIPKNSRLVQASLTRVWMIETDNDGLGSIVRYRVR